MKLKTIMGALAVLAASSSLAPAQDAVSLRLNWYLGGLHVPFYYGKERGFYKEEGIDLTINEGRGSANTVQVVAAGSDTFGLADSSSVVATAVKGAEIKSVMSLLNSTGFSVVSLASAGIRTPKDLEDKKFAVSPGDPLGQLFRALAAHNKLDMSKITFVQVDPSAKVVAVLEKRVDALLQDGDDLGGGIDLHEGDFRHVELVVRGEGAEQLPERVAGRDGKLLVFQVLRRPDPGRGQRDHREPRGIQQRHHRFDLGALDRGRNHAGGIRKPERIG